MNPIPLTAPDGRVYAYACGQCHRVGGGSSLLGVTETDGPVPVLVRASLCDATSCCTCRDCGDRLAVGGWGGYCDLCSWRGRFKRLWSDIGTALTWGLATEEQWRACFRDDDDDFDDDADPDLPI
jgi:hypothetical protein